MSSSALPTLTSSQVKEIDRLCEERFAIPTDWLMEAAGWQAARFCAEPTTVVCGVGNNAGDGLAAARHLHRWGRLVSVCCVDAERLKGAAQRELVALGTLGVPIEDTLDFDGSELILDALFGTGLTRAPEGRFAGWIEAVNGAAKKVVALDVPSGLDAETGKAYAPIVNADATITLGLPKRGLAAVGGRIFVADIGIPLEAYAAIRVDVPRDLFAKGDVVEL